MPAPDAYILCTSPRSGSTLLCALLRDSGVAGDPQSYFHRPTLADWRIGLHLNANTSRADILAAATQKGRGTTGIFGLRLQRHSAPFFFDQLCQMHTTANTDAAAVTAQFGPTAYIYLHRADKVAQAVSLVRASQTGLWHRNADGSELERTAPAQAPQYNASAIAAEVETLTAYDNEWEAWFTANRLTPHRVDYDALAAHPGETVNTVLAHLDLPPSTAPKPAVAQLADATNADWIARFRAEPKPSARH